MSPENSAPEPADAFEALTNEPVHETGTNPFGDGDLFGFHDPLDDYTSPFEPVAIPDALVEGLNDAQRRAVTCLSGRLVVIAGPGSGKTRVLTHRIAALLKTGTASPRQVLAMTFTNKAAGEMRTRLEALVGADVMTGMWVATFHSACLRLLRANPAAAGLPVGFNVIDSDDAKKVMRSVLSELGLPADPPDAKKAHALISAAKNAGTIDMLEDWDPWLVEPAREYQRRLGLMGSVDFDDILGRCYDMLIAHPHVLERYRTKFRHVLVDEYQDTNLVQHRLLELFADSAASFCVVGDADQSIYGWRSADPTFMLQMTTSPGATVVVLEENYRSTPQILETCQSIIDGNVSPVRPNLRTSNPDGPPVRFIVCDEDRTEASFVVGEVVSSRAETRAILMRTNAQTRAFEELLTASAEPYTVVGALKFYDRAEVKDALAYLKLAANPRDIVSFVRVANTPRRGLGQVAVDLVVSAATTTGKAGMEVVEEACEDNRFGNRVTKGLMKLRADCVFVTEAIETGPEHALSTIVRGVGLADHWRKDADGGDRVQNLAELVNGAKAFCENQSSIRVDGVTVASLEGMDRSIAYLENVALVAGNMEGDAPLRAVQLMTVHAAKGKEFDDVWVVGVEDGLFPHYLPGEDPDIAEETRLLFVACSRAGHRLTLTRAERRLVFGKVKENSKSQLVANLPSSVERAREGGTGGVDVWKSRSNYAKAGGKVWTSGGAPAKQAAGPRLRSDQVGVGLRVKHPTFGSGVIDTVEGTSVTITFSDLQQRVLSIAYAPLEIDTSN